MTEPPLRVEGLWKGYRGRAVLEDVSFLLDAGTAAAVIGPNGSGKTTLLGCITGDRTPDRGEIRLCGIDPFSDPRRAARCMGFVPEQPYLYGELAVGEMLEFVSAARGLARDDGGREAERLLSLLGMAGTESVLCRELSQGMGRKLAIICALLHRPRTIVLDEALNGLDLSSVDRLLQELDARRSTGAAVAISSHDLSFLADWCECGLLLAPGGGYEWLEGEDWERWRAAPALDLAIEVRGSEVRDL